MDTATLINGLYTAEDLPAYLLRNVATLDHLYKPTDEYCSLVGALRDVMEQFYREICPIVFDTGELYLTKEWLNEHRAEWEMFGYPCFDNLTSGTTHERFRYRIHTDVYYRLELFEHYIAVLREFFVFPKRVLYFVTDRLELDTDSILQRITTNNPVMTHGLREAVEVLQINKTRLYVTNHYSYFDEFFELLDQNPMELILADGNSISEITGWIKRTGYKKKLCNLLSSTTCGVVDDDLNFLKENGYVDNWCDHMRCWDGGVTFFSCRYNVRHVVDHLSYPISVDHRLVSQDFFSFPNPFWNYWNGDLVQLGDEYKRCKCGRIYREFKIKREREQNVYGMFSTQMDDSLNNINCLKRSACYGDVLKVYTNQPLTGRERQQIRSTLPNMHYRFVVEP